MNKSDYFNEEYRRIQNKIQSLTETADFTFALETDSHLSDNTESTCENIHYVDERVRYDCLVHMGDLLNGN